MRLLPKAITENISVKNVKTGFGHDLGGFFCDIYFKKKKVGYLNNDGWGAFPDVRQYDYDEKSTALMQSFKDFLIEQKFGEFIAADFNYTNPRFNDDKVWSDADFHFEEVVEFLCERMAFLKTIEKKQTHSIMYGCPNDSSYKIIEFNVSLDAMKVQHLTYLKLRVDEIKRNLDKGEFIFNTNLDEFLE